MYLLGYTANSKNKSVLPFPTNMFGVGFFCLVWFAFSLSHFKCSEECSTWKKRNTCRCFCCHISKLAEDDFELLLYCEREYRDLNPELMSQAGYVLCLGSSSFLLDKCSVLILSKKMQHTTNDVRIFYRRNWESFLCIENQSCWLCRKISMTQPWWQFGFRCRNAAFRTPQKVVPCLEVVWMHCLSMHCFLGDVFP